MRKSTWDLALTLDLLPVSTTVKITFLLINYAALSASFMTTEIGLQYRETEYKNIQ